MLLNTQTNMERFVQVNGSRKVIPLYKRLIPVKRQRTTSKQVFNKYYNYHACLIKDLLVIM